MSKNRQSCGRNARKKAVRRIQESLSGSTDAGLQSYSASGQPKSKGEVGPPTNRQVAAQLVEQHVENHRLALAECAVRLGAEGCWAYYRKHYAEARLWGIDGEFRQMASAAAARFMGRPAKTLCSTGGA